MRCSSQLAVALLGAKCVLDFGELNRAVRQGWAGEKSGLFEHPPGEDVKGEAY